MPYRGSTTVGWGKGLLVRRKLDEPDELAFYLMLAPPGTNLATLVRVAGTRWTIEGCFEAAKGEVGLDQYEARSWTGWHRHPSPCWRTPTSPWSARRPPGDEVALDLAADLLPLTVPEVRRLLWRLVWERGPDLDTALAWSR